MSQQEPDAWVVLKTQGHCRIFAQFRAWGFGQSDSWRLSSLVSQIEEHDDHFLCISTTPTKYKLRKDQEGIGNQWCENKLQEVINTLEKVTKVERLDVSTNGLEKLGS